jgi:hypothetical protein
MGGLVLASFLLASQPVFAQAQPESRNIELVGHNDLNGNGDGGEGLALQRMPDSRRLLYLAHEGQTTCLSVIDVTKPDNPVLVTQLPSPTPGVTRCNSLGLSGNVLAVANQTLNRGQAGMAGMWALDVSNFAKIQSAKTLDDLKLSFFDTSGPNSRGVHNLWFVDGEFAHLTTGMRDFDPINGNDDQIYVAVDLRDPRNPKEVGRWWMPGTRKGDTCLPECQVPRHPKWDNGYRPHQVEIWPDHPDRAYVAYIEGGVMIWDISGLADVKAGRARTFTPKVLGKMNSSPPFTGFTHTFQPMFNRGLALVSDEETKDNCADAPKTVWLMDINVDANPLIIGTAPLHPNDAELCKRGGRFGAHNIHPNFPGPNYKQLRNTAVTAWFNGGVRIYRIANDASGIAGYPPHLEELGYYIPAAPATNPNNRTISINHVIVDENGLIYANDRFKGGLYILRYTGAVPMD